MKIVLCVLLPTFAILASGSFTEDSNLWLQVDSLNEIYNDSEAFTSDELEVLFEHVADLALSYEFFMQFEDLRADAFDSDDFELCDGYAERALPLVNVFVLGDFNAIGVNVAAFYEKAEEPSEAYQFFMVAVGGFYIDGENLALGTAELPAWLVSEGSGFQASVDFDQAHEWMSFWLTIQPSLDGYFLEVAEETILGLENITK